MSGTWGNKIKYSIFGESHGFGVGITIDGLPPGIRLDLDMIRLEMARRSPGNSVLATSRQETDQFDILSGYFNEHTTGAPLCAMIKNTNCRSGDYEKQKNLLRPGHADYTAYIKYSGFHDYRGGGHFSGRLTAPLVFAGAIAKQLLKQHDIQVGSHIYSIGSCFDKSFTSTKLETDILNLLAASSFPTLDSNAGVLMQDTILAAKERGDSVGGIVEAMAVHLPVGLGSPFFDSLESTISHLVFSIPGAKGIEFGDGFAIAHKHGSETNDCYTIENNLISTLSNHNGGIIGGISNGNPLIFRVAFKPTPSIAMMQNTVDIHAMKNAPLSTTGRHDPCIVPRALPVVEAVTAIAILEHLH